MNQYIEYIREAIIETVTYTNDSDLLNMIYGIMMNNEPSQEECPSVS